MFCKNCATFFYNCYGCGAVVLQFAAFGLVAYAAKNRYISAMKLFFASGNRHKQAEVAKLFPQHEVLIPADIGIDFDPEENGSSFVENSLIKAKALYEIVKVPVIADDSGICVDALNGAPGIFSARYAGIDDPAGKNHGEKLTSPERNRLLLEHVEKTFAKSNDSNKQRSCRFVCAMVLYLGSDRFYAVQETIEGELVNDIKSAEGVNGFGYDPIFYLPQYGKTVAQLSDEEKNAISHRGKAAKKIAELL